MITIYQIQITDRQADDFNAGISVPSIEASRKLMFGSKEFTPDMLSTLLLFMRSTLMI